MKHSIHEFFRGREVATGELADFLDNLPPFRRVEEALRLDAKEQAALFDAVRDERPVKLEDIVPEECAPMKEVIHYGRNTLPMFSYFQKRFCRPDEEGLRELWGYNHQLLSPVTGPGYFVTRNCDDGEVLVDYLCVPPRHPAGWPEILPNSARLSRFIYYNTRDYLRGVSAHVTIGRATRKGKPMDNWFVLCRED
ncbi:MAG: hypothetical protein KDH09_15785 [Chrysiogenetes bacterium]|nr:hypothetical protein [Chrysiogenetes bacterium]